MGTLFYRICQCTWGLPQTLLGLGLFLRHRKSPHTPFHGALVIHWQRRFSVSLGMFLFLAPGSSPFATPEMLLRHEYGHSIQSLILGPLYLFLIGIPSALWAQLPWCIQKRQREQLPYSAFFVEAWADRLGERLLEGCNPRY